MADSRTPNTGGLHPMFGCLLRFTQDSVAQTWHILVKPVDGGRVRLFCDLESLFGYLEEQILIVGDRKGTGENNENTVI